MHPHYTGKIAPKRVRALEAACQPRRAGARMPARRTHRAKGRARDGAVAACHRPSQRLRCAAGSLPTLSRPLSCAAGCHSAYKGAPAATTAREVCTARAAAFSTGSRWVLGVDAPDPQPPAALRRRLPRRVQGGGRWQRGPGRCTARRCIFDRVAMGARRRPGRRTRGLARPSRSVAALSRPLLCAAGCPGARVPRRIVVWCIVFVPSPFPAAALRRRLPLTERRPLLCAASCLGARVRPPQTRDCPAVVGLRWAFVSGGGSPWVQASTSIYGSSCINHVRGRSRARCGRRVMLCAVRTDSCTGYGTSFRPRRERAVRGAGGRVFVLWVPGCLLSCLKSARVGPGLRSAGQETQAVPVLHVYVYVCRADCARVVCTVESSQTQ